MKAATPNPPLRFVEGACPDCGQRQAELPPPLPELGDDFAWVKRDHEGLRMAMLEELAARFAQRRRWTPADPEVALVEVLASALDQLSDMLDRVHAEAFLETARQPSSVRRLLSLIGHDAVAAHNAAQAPAAAVGADALDALWRADPGLMQSARQAGPRQIHEQRRIVTCADVVQVLEQHPLVLQAHSWLGWNGSWQVLHVAVALRGGLSLADAMPKLNADDTRRLALLLERFHCTAEASTHDGSSCGAALQGLLQALRMAGQELRLQDPLCVGVELDLRVELAGAYFQSEVRRAVLDVLGTGAEGFFAEGRLRFGQDLRSSDIVQALMQVEGVASVVLQRFARVGGADQTQAGVIRLDGIELASCDPFPVQPGQPARGSLRLTCTGGLKG
jgi:hypothetical protein